MCLIFGQTVETPKLQQNFWGGRKLSAELSPGTVDSLTLVVARITVQRSSRIIPETR
ncbi:hypothetical protein ROLI_034770 [Roseobacter fucihabitans]|uniref:Uncharacterized protein n=1 Tax=Roseobacter fucihabitans TaxID=1537242 RepID=A0ABZ2BYV4_9RHOB|nr:hypothetical protein [Roseobacter litoralis]